MDWFLFNGYGFGGVCIRHKGLENFHHGDRSLGNSSRLWLVVSTSKVSAGDDDNDVGPHLNLQNCKGFPKGQKQPLEITMSWY